MLRPVIFVFLLGGSCLAQNHAWTKSDPVLSMTNTGGEYPLADILDLNAAFLASRQQFVSDGEDSKMPSVGDVESTNREQHQDAENGQNRRRSPFDPQEMARGEAAFENSCTDCHEAERSTSKRKSRSAWMATIRRMSRMDGADIDPSDFGFIATYLTSLHARTSSEIANGSSLRAATDTGGVSDEILDSGLNASATISTLHRSGNDNLENPGFFVDAWLRADWQPSGPLRGRVTACTSCHNDHSNGAGFTFELVEATAHLDLLHWYKENCPKACQPKMEAEIKAGRFVVPFGAFAAMSHPGIYRTVTNPLMFNMGRQVNDNRQFAPVLPAPFADEGVDLFAKMPLFCDWTATLDVYAINGLQGSGSGVQFTPSRDYTDNNNEPTVGGRATIGKGKFRMGGSVMAGRMEDDRSLPLNYKLVGADATAKVWDDQIRLYFEYAIRTNDTNLPEDQIAYGIVSEMEILLWEDPNLNALFRYDTLEHRNFFGDTSVDRFTWGLSTTAIGGSLFIINHEHWNFPTGEEDVDVIGLRWVATF